MKTTSFPTKTTTGTLDDLRMTRKGMHYKAVYLGKGKVRDCRKCCFNYVCVANPVRCPPGEMVWAIVRPKTLWGRFLYWLYATGRGLRRQAGGW